MARPAGRIRRFGRTRESSRVGSGHQVIEISRVGSDRVGSGGVRISRAGSGGVRISRVESDHPVPIRPYRNGLVREKTRIFFVSFLGKWCTCLAGSKYNPRFNSSMVGKNSLCLDLDWYEYY